MPAMRSWLVDYLRLLSYGALRHLPGKIGSDFETRFIWVQRRFREKDESATAAFQASVADWTAAPSALTWAPMSASSASNWPTAARTFTPLNPILGPSNNSETV